MATADTPATAPSRTRRPYKIGVRADATQALRARIVDAMLEGMRRDDYETITLDVIAASAGTTRQTVIRLFGSKDGVLAALFEQVDQQVETQRFSANDGDLAALARSVVTDLEIKGNLVLRLQRHEHRVPIIAQRFALARARHLATLRRELARLLDRLDAVSGEMAVLQARAVTDTLFWNILRNDMGLDPSAAEATLLDVLRKIFAGADPTVP